MAKFTNYKIKHLPASIERLKMKYKSIKIDEESASKLDNMRNGKPYSQILRQLLGLPEMKHNKPRKRRSRLIRAIRTLIH